MHWLLNVIPQQLCLSLRKHVRMKIFTLEEVLIYAASSFTEGVKNSVLSCAYTFYMFCGEYNMLKPINMFSSLITVLCIYGL